MARSRSGLPGMLPPAAMVAVAAICAAAPALAEVYRWVGPDGVTHYSDEPRRGAQRIDPGEPSVIRMAPEARSGTRAGAEPQQQAADYRQFAIAEPQPEATLRGHPGDVPVRIELTPALRPGHSLRLLLDGEPAPRQPGGDLRVVLPSLPRGAHSVRAEILDAQGEVVARTEPVTFYMHRPSVNLPARSNNGN